MTAQIPDTVQYLRTRYALTAVEGSGLFDPADHGLSPGAMSTGCWRGFICGYSVSRKRLSLQHLEISLGGQSPALFGVVPAQEDERMAVYQGLAAHIEFTGRILIGAEHVPGTPYLNMGFWPAWMYARVHELAFTAGVLRAAADRSTELAEVRRRLGPAAARPAPGESTKEWISRTFSLDFSYSWPPLPQ